METFSTSLALCTGNSSVTDEFPTQRPVRRNFDVFFDLSRNKRMSKQSWSWWFETPWHPSWRHCNGLHSCYKRNRANTWRHQMETFSALLGAVSLTSRELPKIFSRKYTTPEITFMVIISIWKFVRTKFQLEILITSTICAIHKFRDNFWKARETLVKQPPGLLCEEFTGPRWIPRTVTRSFDHRGEVMYISLIDFQWTCTKTKSLQ